MCKDVFWVYAVTVIYGFNFIIANKICLIDNHPTEESHPLFYVSLLTFSHTPRLLQSILHQLTHCPVNFVPFFLC
jgi:hypothetical protein